MRIAVTADRPTDSLRQNNLLHALPLGELARMAPHIETVRLGRGETLFEPGDRADFAYFPAPGTMISFILSMRDGHRVEAVTIGQEGTTGIISSGHPAFATGVVHCQGVAFRMSLEQLESAKQQCPRLRQLFSIYANILQAQILQTVGCNLTHSTEQRFCRWLLTVQDRIGNDIALTQEVYAQLLGVQRTTLSEAVQRLQKSGVIRHSRGHLFILDRRKLRKHACECYDTVCDHADRMLPPQFTALRGNYHEDG